MRPLLLGALLATATPAIAQEESTLRINLVESPASFDPGRSRDLAAFNVLNALYEGLMRVQPDGSLASAIVERVDVDESQKVYTFHLKKSVWSNGDPLTAHDFAESWKRMLATDFPSDYAFLLYPIEGAEAAKKGNAPIGKVGIQAVDKHTLRVTLAAPTPYFLRLTATPALFPAHKSLRKGSSEEELITNGPYRLESNSFNDKIVLTKNSRYQDASRVELGTIEMVMVSPDTELLMWEGGELDWVGSPISTLPTDALPFLKEDKALHQTPALGSAFIRLNNTHPLLSDVSVRHALSTAIDREGVVKHVLEGMQTPAYGLVPPSLKSEAVAYFTDRAAEKALASLAKGLERLGMEKGEAPALHLLYSDDPRTHKIAQALQQQWKNQLGIDVVLERQERKVYFSRVRKMDYDLAIGSWIGDFPDPINFLEVFKYNENSPNNTGWVSERYQQLLDRSSTEGNEKRLATLEEAEKLLIAEMPIVPLFYYTYSYLQSPKYENILLSGEGVLDFSFCKPVAR